MLLSPSLVLIALLGPLSPALASPVRRWSAPPIIDLGYTQVQGYTNDTSALYRWNGIRFAQASRFEAAREPDTNRTVQVADTFGPVCYQSTQGARPLPAGNATIASASATRGASEDCLFLNVFAPYGSDCNSKLPVLVWIHGGGYALGNGQGDWSEFVNLGNNSFVVVSIQYRLGAFGFLGGSEYVDGGGLTNAGLRDQQYAFQWVQQHIEKFGGNPDHVTIWGESAGAGSVMTQVIANGGDTTSALGLSKPLFSNVIASSVFLPGQYECSSAQPSTYYDQLVELAGCTGNATYACLKGLSGDTLANASYLLTERQPYGLYSMIPCTDGSFLTDRPSVLLAKGSQNLNGMKIAAINNANEGVSFTDPTIVKDNTTNPTALAAQFDALVAGYMPQLSSAERESVAAEYPIDQSITTGNSFDRLRMVITDATFVCPTYWLAQAFDSAAHKGFFAYGTALHGFDQGYYLNKILEGPRSLSSIQSFTGALLGSVISYDPNNSPLPAINPYWPTFDTDGELEFRTDNDQTNGTAMPIELDANINGTQWPRCDFWRGPISASVPL